MMDNTKEQVPTTLLISIGLAVAIFLLNTGRVLQAIKMCQECFILLRNGALREDIPDTKLLYQGVFTTAIKAHFRLFANTSTEEYLREQLLLFQESDNPPEKGWLQLTLAKILQDKNKFAEAVRFYKSAMAIMKTNRDSHGEAITYGNLGILFRSLTKYDKAQEYQEKALAITIKIGDKKGEAASYGNLGTLFQSHGRYDKAQEYQEKALAIRIEIGDKKGEATSYGNLGTLFQSLDKYDKAQEYEEKALAIRKEMGEKEGEARSYGNLGTLFQSLGRYDKAQEYQEKALAIRKEIDEKEGEATSYGNLGALFQSLGRYDKAQEYQEKALAIRKEIGEKEGEARSYGNLGTLFRTLGRYDKAQEYQEKALAIRKEIGEKQGEAASYGNLGTLFQSLCRYDKAQEYEEKALAIRIEIGDKKGEAASYGNLGTLFHALGRYDKAQEYQEKALAISIEICDKGGEAARYANLGTLFGSLGEHDKAFRYFDAALLIAKSIPCRATEVSIYGNLAALFLSSGKFSKGDDYLKKARAIRMKIGDRAGEGADYRNLGLISLQRGEYIKAEEYHKKALAIHLKMGHRDEEAAEYFNLGVCFNSLGNYDLAEEYLKKGLLLSKDIGRNPIELKCLCNLAVLRLSQFDRKGAFSYLYRCTEKFDTLRGFIKDSDQFKISLLEEHGASIYQLLSWLLSSIGSSEDALYVEELKRARGLADLMAAQFCIEEQISGNPQSWCGIQNIIMKESDSTCLYISVGKADVRFWILKAKGAIHFIKKEASPNKNELTGLVPDLDKFLKESFCNPAKDITKTNLHLCHNIIIASVADLLREPEIIIVPDSCMYQVPFAALTDKEGKYFSDTFKIRIVPSMTTLKLIQDSPPEYHSKSGALIVGDPEVREVLYKGRCTIVEPLPRARKEAETIGSRLGVKPLIGDRATKQAVLQAINSVSLIHFAAHGSPDRGEIVLCPKDPIDCPPREKDYLLTMKDISEVQVRAKLVVLSCCHSARGQVKAEGVVGIARAFLGSGARSVLAARWALEDEATEEFMSCFYDHLFRGKSASESLHEARKWMRGNGFDKVSQWASFMLIGDNVTFDFENWPKSTTP
ncbi:tetratricopeptide repeat protein 28-like [Stylophora pistillata]|uniref:tetratricopeptide repeat protein 28-like n=1 Tax=Stylophora pistillata TaxID=50429 RepID=UPI000C04C4DD|nr:tetratricopeptide repeat protein 28-like [Stylophora pistillata]